MKGVGFEETDISMKLLYGIAAALRVSGAYLEGTTEKLGVSGKAF
jgi:hypothetical protein